MKTFKVLLVIFCSLYLAGCSTPRYRQKDSTVTGKYPSPSTSETAEQWMLAIAPADETQVVYIYVPKSVYDSVNIGDPYIFTEGVSG